MVDFKATATTENVLTAAQIDNGRLYITQDTKSLYVDYDDIRLKIGDVIFLNTENQRLMTLAPLSNKLYLVKETGILWFFTTDWVQIGTSSGGTNDYETLINQPQINSITLTGNKSLSDLGIQGINDESLNTVNKTVIGAINEIKQTFDDAIVTPDASYSTPVVYGGTDFNGQISTFIDSKELPNATGNNIVTYLDKSLTINDSGYYHIVVEGQFANTAADAGKKLTAYISINGVSSARTTFTIADSNNFYLHLDALLQLNANDILTLGFQSYTVARTFNLTVFSAARIYSPFDLDEIKTNINNLQNDLGDISSLLDNINGEVI